VYSNSYEKGLPLCICLLFSWLNNSLLLNRNVSHYRIQLFHTLIGHFKPLHHNSPFLYRILLPLVLRSPKWSYLFQWHVFVLGFAKICCLVSVLLVLEVKMWLTDSPVAVMVFIIKFFTQEFLGLYFGKLLKRKIWTFPKWPYEEELQVQPPELHARWQLNQVDDLDRWYSTLQAPETHWYSEILFFYRSEF
jgi:hypothetical protein